LQIPTFINTTALSTWIVHPQLKLSQQFGLSMREQELAKVLGLDLDAMLKGGGEGQEPKLSSSTTGPGLQPLLSAFLARVEGGKKHMGATMGGGAR